MDIITAWMGSPTGAAVALAVLPIVIVAIVWSTLDSLTKR